MDELDQESIELTINNESIEIKNDVVDFESHNNFLEDFDIDIERESFFDGLGDFA